MPSISFNVTKRRATYAVPLDVVDLILHHLTFGMTYYIRCSPSIAMRTLYSCRLVCKSWLYLCRSYIYREIQLGNTSRESLHEVQRLDRLIQTEPSIGSMVRTLGHNDFESDSEDSMDIVTWERRDEFLSCLRRMPNVRHLEIFCTAWHCYEEAGFRCLGWRVTFDYYVSCRNLTSLCIWGVGDLPVLPIISSPNLEQLQLDKCFFLDLNPGLSSRAAQACKSKLKSLKAKTMLLDNVLWPLFAIIHPHLEHLALIALSRENDDWYPHSISFPHLTSLFIRDWSDWSTLRILRRDSEPRVLGGHVPSGQTTSVGSNAISNTFPALENLTIISEGHGDFRESHWYEIQALVNPSWATLVHVVVTLHLHESYTVDQFLLGLNDMLAAGKRKNVLKSLEVVLGAYMSDSDSPQDSLKRAQSHHRGWSRLGSTIVDDKRDFPCFQRLCVHYYLGWHTLFPYENYEVDQKILDSILSEPLEKVISCPDINFEYQVSTSYLSL
ncbi:hypothetical protein BJ165DRAFT_1611122 [Panaeolus papilionaceus]|nr:hypothetical protein BJ165DRAFT_1611122 [Panaeolus papilionaceus]